MLSLSKHNCADEPSLLLQQAQDEVSEGNSRGQTGHFFSAPSGRKITIPIDLLASFILERTAALSAPTQVLSLSRNRIDE